jgi:predicted aldo/keto reductase-like oxidoreductase
MEKIRLGRTNLMVSRSGFGGIPIQRVSFAEAEKVLRKAYEGGIRYFDTARRYTDSEEKIGRAFSDVRSNVHIATKTLATTRKGVLADLQQSLKNLKTDYVDIHQLHSPDPLPDPNDPESAYAGQVEAKKAGMTRFISMTNHKYDNAVDAVKSGLWDTLQFPLSPISSARELAVIELCKQHDVGVIAMKGLAGGLIDHAAPAFAFLRQYDNLLTLWGIDHEWQVDEFISLEKKQPKLDAENLAMIEKWSKELAGDFCRGCGYCLPCPLDIFIPMLARMPHHLKESPDARFVNEEWKVKMDRIEDCIDCGHCKEHCPYELNPPELLKKALVLYRERYIKVKGTY